MRYAEGVARRIAAVAAVADAQVKALDADWFYEVRGDRLHYRDARGEFDTPLTGLPDPHQPGNMALAIAMLRQQTQLVISTTAIETAARCANWPARMQRLTDGTLTRLLPAASALWLDGGHNQAAGAAVATAIADLRGGPPLHLGCGMPANKAPAGFLAPPRRPAYSGTAASR